MPKMHGLLEKILAANEAERKARIFHYSSYWGTWSRKLKDYDDGPVKGTVELNLTPIHTYNDWNKSVAPIVFRIHGTTPDREDRDEKQLPDYVLANMIANIGEELTNRLLTEDWLSLIDLELCKRNSNGGCPFEKCKKG